MAAYTNKSGGTLILPDGSKVSDGQDVNVAEDALKNVGVQKFIADGQLVAKPAKPEKKKAVSLDG